APDGTAVPAELQRLAAGDHLTRLARQAHRRRGLPHRSGLPAPAPAMPPGAPAPPPPAPALPPGAPAPPPPAPAVPPGASGRPARAAALPSGGSASAADADRISLVSVCRSTLMNRRQPIRWYQVSLVQPHGLARRYR